MTRPLGLAKHLALEALAAQSVHKINQPLTAISVYAQACIRMLDQPQHDPEALRQTLQKISATATDAGNLMHRIRDENRFRQPAETTELRDVLDDVLELPEIDLGSELPDRLGFINVEREHLAWALGDLARKLLLYPNNTDVQGTLRISATITRAKSSIEPHVVTLRFYPGHSYTSPAAYRSRPADLPTESFRDNLHDTAALLLRQIGATLDNTEPDHVNDSEMTISIPVKN